MIKRFASKVAGWLVCSLPMSELRFTSFGKLAAAGNTTTSTQLFMSDVAVDEHLMNMTSNAIVRHTSLSFFPPIAYYIGAANSTVDVARMATSITFWRPFSRVGCSEELLWPASHSLCSEKLSPPPCSGRSNTVSAAIDPERS